MNISPSLLPSWPLSWGLTASQCHLIALIFASSYVGSIYLTQHVFLPRAILASAAATQAKAAQGSAAKASNASHVDVSSKAFRDDDDDEDDDEEEDDAPKLGTRDHPTTIRLRMKAVGIATVSSLLIVWSVVKHLSGTSWTESLLPTIRLLGLSIPSFSCLSWTWIFPYLLTPILFLGPLFAEYLDRSLPFQRSSSSPLAQKLIQLFDFSIIDYRNYVVGPITEELTFRSAIIAIFLLSHASPSSIVFGSPLWFGTAHIHHAWEVYRSGGSTSQSAQRAVLTSLIQFTYTTLFGWFASYLFIRTGSVFPPLASHIFCNRMGIYLPGRAARRHPSSKTAILCAYVAGMAGFILCLWVY
ncbi:hypothetical protein BD324DRAFT_158918 [Kockovaella imperatae]|uniref:intramembrane prenyl-peptidase Rce1 n=1 Tax=Kockovaella imperatae TaxID=4999 RepID=A0A1Y1UAM5_9TREE|nr:hypothetical protein BD324DRAFT_158918 [Kockovaella imperatae]ORX34546.1 hypothetical protein BD324DRAFT_158918 [Kockovaella imperatae]